MNTQELSKVCRQVRRDIITMTANAGGRRAAREKIIEILHARPRGRFVVGIDVVPAKGRRVVHHTRTGIDALGRKIRAVAADAFVVVIARIAPVRPDMRIAHRRGAVVWQ